MKLKALRAAQRLKASSLGEKTCKLVTCLNFATTSCTRDGTILNYEKYDEYSHICDIYVQDVNNTL